MGKKLPRSINVGKKLKNTDMFLKYGIFWDMKNGNAKSSRIHQYPPLPLQGT